MDLLKAGPVHLLPHDPLDVADNHPAEGQPREDARSGSPHITRPNEEPVAGDIGVGWIVPQGAQEQGGHPEGRETGHRPQP
jgi:hypothetical protein